MDVQYSPEVLRQLEALPLIESYSDRLEAVVGSEDSPKVRATWELIPRVSEPPRYRLTLSDPDDSASVVLGTADLKNVPLVHFDLTRLWGSLLGKRVDRLHEHSMRLLAELASE